jgi:predicted permease
MSVRRHLHRLVALFRGRHLDRELDEELQAHLELAERDAVASGMSLDDARRAARLALGSVAATREAHRDARSARWIENMMKDARYAVASLRRDPGFTATVVGVLALGIGANVAMLSVVDAAFLKPLQLHQPDRIVQVFETSRSGGFNNTSAPDFLDWRRLGSSFAALAAEDSIAAALTGDTEPRRLAGKAVTGDYFEVFGLHTDRGRTFAAEEDRPSAAPVIVLSHAAWRTEFGSDPDILQRHVVLDGQAHQVVGVLRPGPFDREETRFWKPLALNPEEHPRDWHWLTVYGRLAGDATLAGARDEMEAVDRALADVTPAFKRDWTISVEPLVRRLIGDELRRAIAVAFGAVALVLLIACANVANLLIARSSTRTKEMAVRAALGASRGRLVSQLLAETLMLCLVGGVAGVALASVLVRVADAVLLAGVPYLAPLRVDLRMLAFTGAVVALVALVVGIFPSLQPSIRDLAGSLRQSNRGSSAARTRLRRATVIGEVALSLVLVCGAFLLLRSLQKLQYLDTGISVENVITLSANLAPSAYASAPAAAMFYDAVVEGLEAAPGIERAALTSHQPLQWITQGEGLQAAGREDILNVRYKRVDAGYFEALDIPLLRGRGITRRDRLGAPRVVLINEALAARLVEYAGITSPIGRIVKLSAPHYAAKGMVYEDFEIVGIIRSERVAPPGRPDPPVVYVSIAQVPRPDFRILVRTRAEPATAMAAIRDAVRRVDPRLPLGDMATLRQVRSGTLQRATRPAWIIGSFAAVAALLAALGLYGVLAYLIVQRRREVGIRMALGAERRDVIALVLRDAVAMIAIGVAFGLAGAVGLTRVIGSLLFEVSPLDPAMLVMACATMVVIGLAAGALPAWRAAALTPLDVLREG